MSAGVRRRGRWYALQVLYALDINAGAAPDDALDSYIGAFDLDLDDRARAFAGQLVRATVAHLGEVDEIIQSVSRNWRLERMSRVDRNILRLSTCELKYTPEVPVKVAINEAVELAKRFGTAESPAFVNGLLDRIAQGLDRADERA